MVVPYPSNSRNNYQGWRCEDNNTRQLMAFFLMSERLLGSRKYIFNIDRMEIFSAFVSEGA
jgi:hypothetical protein